MAFEFDFEQAQDILDQGMSGAQELLEDPSKVGGLLEQIPGMLKNLPANVGEQLFRAPEMVDMVKSYITREYTEVSPKVIISLVSAFMYFVSKNDLIADNVPILGLIDDIAVVALAMKLSEPELDAFKAWKESNGIE